MLAFRNLLHDRVRFAVTLVGIVFSVVLSAVQLGLFLGFTRATVDVIERSNADLWVMSAGVTHLESGAPLKESLRHLALGVDGVADAQAHIVTFGTWQRPTGARESVAPESTDSARVFTVADMRRLRVRVDVDEHDVARVAAGQPAWVTADAYGGRRFEGTVVRVGSLLGRKNIRTDEPAEKVDTRVLETLIELSANARLPVGLRVDAFIGARDGRGSSTQPGLLKNDARQPSHHEQQPRPGQDGGQQVDTGQHGEDAVNADEVERDAEGRGHDLGAGDGGALAEGVHQGGEQRIGFEVDPERGDADVGHDTVGSLREQEQHDHRVAEARVLGDGADQAHARPPGRPDAAAARLLARRP